jgi:hypothetical protein
VDEALQYKTEGHGSGAWWGNQILSIYLILKVALGPGVYSANRHKYQRQT